MNDMQVMFSIRYKEDPPVSVQDLPDDCPKVLADMMTFCLVRDLHQRPSFNGKTLSSLLQCGSIYAVMFLYLYAF